MQHLPIPLASFPTLSKSPGIICSEMTERQSFLKAGYVLGVANAFAKTIPAHVSVTTGPGKRRREEIKEKKGEGPVGSCQEFEKKIGNG